MKVAFVVTAFPTLSYTFILDKITGLIDRGHEVDVFADRPGQLDQMHPDVERYGLLNHVYCPPMPNNVAMRYVTGAGLMLTRGWRRPGVMLRSLNAFRHGELASSLVLLYGAIPLLRMRSYDIIHAQFGPNGLKAMFLRENGLLEGKLITHFYGYDVNVYPRRRGAKVYHQLFQVGDLYTANSRFLAERAISLGCPAGRILDLPIGADLSKFAFSERRRKPGDPIRILTVARLVEVKGLEYSIAAVAKAISEYPEIQYQIVGDGPLLGRLRQLVSQLGIKGHVQFLGGRTQDEVIELYAGAHLFVLASVVGADGAEEGHGTVLTEAKATGLPVISSRVGGIPENVLDGKSGFLVPQRDVEALTDKLSHLIEHPQLCAAMGRAGRKHVEENLDIQRLNDRLVQVYEQLLNGTLP